MRSLFCVAAFSVLAACMAATRPVSGPPAGYVRPDIEALLSGARSSATSGLDVETERAKARGYWTPPVAQALWAGVQRAEEYGLVEMYGVEMFGVGEPGYDAVFFVRLPGDRVYCLLANDELQGSRPDADSVPALPVDPEAFEQLRRRVSVELPLRQNVDLDADACDGALYLLHAYRDGQSHHALWYEPRAEWDRYRENAMYYRDSYPVVSIVNALHAAVPAELLPTFHDFDWYDRTPPIPDDPQGR